MAKYEVRDGKTVKMHSEHIESIYHYDKYTRNQIKKSGLKIYEDGKLWKDEPKDEHNKL